MSFIEVAKAIFELGIMVVICAVYIITSIKDRKRQEEMNSELLKKVIEGNLTANKPHVLTPEEDKRAIEINKAVNNTLQSCVAETKANRGLVVRYHNGGVDMSAIPFLKLSITNEIMNIGYKPIIQDYQNQFRSIVEVICTEVGDAGFFYVDDINSIKDRDAGTYELLNRQNVGSFYCHAICDENNHITGFVMLLYLAKEPKPENLDDIKESLRDTANKVSALLDL